MGIANDQIFLDQPWEYDGATPSGDYAVMSKETTELQCVLGLKRNYVIPKSQMDGIETDFTLPIPGAAGPNVEVYRNVVREPDSQHSLFDPVTVRFITPPNDEYIVVRYYPLFGTPNTAGKRLGLTVVSASGLLTRAQVINKLVLVDTSTQSISITLPELDPADVMTMTYIKRKGAGALTVNTSGANEIFTPNGGVTSIPIELDRGSLKLGALYDFLDVGGWFPIRKLTVSVGGLIPAPSVTDPISNIILED